MKKRRVQITQKPHQQAPAWQAVEHKIGPEPVAFELVKLLAAPLDFFVFFCVFITIYGDPVHLTGIAFRILIGELAQPC